MEDMFKTLVGLKALDAINENDRLKNEANQTRTRHDEEIRSLQQSLNKELDSVQSKLRSAEAHGQFLMRSLNDAHTKAKRAQQETKELQALLCAPLEKIASASKGFKYNFAQLKAMHAVQLLQTLAIREQCEQYARALGKSADDIATDREAAARHVQGGQSAHSAAALEAKKAIIEAEKLKRERLGH